MAAPASAATLASFSGLSGAEYDTAGVFVLGTVNFTGDTDDGGGFDSVLFQLWDDFAVKFQATYSVGVGLAGSFNFSVFYPGLVGTAAQGVGLYLYDTAGSGALLLALDPYNVPHYADPGQCTVDCGPDGTVPVPATLPLLLAGLGGIAALARRRRS